MSTLSRDPHSEDVPYVLIPRDILCDPHLPSEAFVMYGLLLSETGGKGGVTALPLSALRESMGIRSYARLGTILRQLMRAGWVDWAKEGESIEVHWPKAVL